MRLGGRHRRMDMAEQMERARIFLVALALGYAGGFGLVLNVVNAVPVEQAVDLP